jgi:hypothetical protein
MITALTIGVAAFVFALLAGIAAFKDSNSHSAVANSENPPKTLRRPFGIRLACFWLILTALIRLACFILWLKDSHTTPPPIGILLFLAIPIGYFIIASLAWNLRLTIAIIVFILTSVLDALPSSNGLTAMGTWLMFIAHFAFIALCFILSRGSGGLKFKSLLFPCSSGILVISVVAITIIWNRPPGGMYLAGNGYLHSSQLAKKYRDYIEKHPAVDNSVLKQSMAELELDASRDLVDRLKSSAPVFLVAGFSLSMLLTSRRRSSAAAEH